MFDAGQMPPALHPIPGLVHITLAGRKAHGMKGLELWMSTLAPGGATPIHRWAGSATTRFGSVVVTTALCLRARALCLLAMSSVTFAAAVAAARAACRLITGLPPSQNILQA